jgi:hypothetical protein
MKVLGSRHEAPAGALDEWTGMHAARDRVQHAVDDERGMSWGSRAAP